MLKINPFDIPGSKQVTVSKGSKPAAGKIHSPFAQELSETLQADAVQNIESELADLKDQEKRFLDSKSLADLNAYKLKVQKILNLILQEGFQSTTLKRRSRNRADFLVIKDIDAKLLEITAKISRGNKAFDLMKELEEIRGLILDLVK